MESKTLQFIIGHDGEDITRLLLSPGKYPGVDIPLAARCIEARKKIKGKIPEFYAAPSLLYPDPLALEQCSSQATALYKAALVPSGAVTADLTGGLGVDSYFISRRANHHTYFERKPHLAEAAQENFRTLGAENIDCHTAELRKEDILSEEFPRFDLIYLDPARRDRSGGRVFSVAECEPNLIEWRDALLAKANVILAKISPMADITQVLEELPGISQVHILSTDHECKEVLLLITSQQVAEPEIHCINILKEGTQSLTFRKSEEATATASYGTQGQCYLYEPNKSVMKGGCFKWLCGRYGVDKIAPATHLYTSEKLVEDFPGKCFAIEESLPFNKRAISEIKGRCPRASVSAKNFPLTSQELAKRLATREDDRRHIFGCTTLSSDKLLLLTSRLY